MLVAANILIALTEAKRIREEEREREKQNNKEIGISMQKIRNMIRENMCNVQREREQK